ncbi:serine--tRNA ligase [Striga asiatica]|uniref:Serine--tRNA ligase n=1 Tax=Striga asiatica TaxID=4170 RepID=A0A5A7RFN6_STRAF|nr:serine--tRNA ligase [Striga asiatica]
MPTADQVQESRGTNEETPQDPINGGRNMGCCRRYLRRLAANVHVRQLLELDDAMRDPEDLVEQIKNSLEPFFQVPRVVLEGRDVFREWICRLELLDEPKLAVIDSEGREYDHGLSIPRVARKGLEELHGDRDFDDFCIGIGGREVGSVENFIVRRPVGRVVEGLLIMWRHSEYRRSRVVSRDGPSEAQDILDNGKNGPNVEVLHVGRVSREDLLGEGIIVRGKYAAITGLAARGKKARGLMGISDGRIKLIVARFVFGRDGRETPIGHRRVRLECRDKARRHCLGNGEGVNWAMTSSKYGYTIRHLRACNY